MALPFSYAAGGTAPTLVRSTIAYFRTTAGLVTQAAINAVRDAHYRSIGGTRRLLLEGARTTEMIQSESFDNSNWFKNSCTVTADATTAPDGNTTADKIVEAAATGSPCVFITGIAGTASTKQAFSVYVKPAGRNWCFLQIRDKSGAYNASFFNVSTGTLGTIHAQHSARMTAVTNGWYLIELVDAGAAGGGGIELYIGAASADTVASYAGDGTSGIYAWGPTFEADRPNPSSYILTASSSPGTIARGRDDAYLADAGFTPVAQTAYWQGLNLGTAQLANGTYFAFGNGTGSRVICRQNGANLELFHHNGTSGVTGTVAVQPAMYDDVEIRAVIFADGSVQVGVALNGGSETLGAASGANTLAGSWSAARMYLNSDGAGGNDGFSAVQQVKVQTGNVSLTTLRGGGGGGSLPLGLINGGLIGNPLVNRGLIRSVR